MHVGVMFDLFPFAYNGLFDRPDNMQCTLYVYRSVLLERMETVMHSEFGGSEYWAVSKQSFGNNLHCIDI